jgi:hypothetical protein
MLQRAGPATAAGDQDPSFPSRRDTDMPSFEHHGAHIYYEEFGQGFPILTFAPAGLASVIEV